MSNTNVEQSEESNTTITVKLDATVEIHRRVDQGSDYVGEHVDNVDHFDDYEGIPQIICQETRNVVVHKRFEDGYPNLDAYTRGVVTSSPAKYFDQEVIDVLDISGQWDGPDWKVADYQITVSGSEQAWERQVVTWCSERPTATTRRAIDRFRGWDAYENITVSGIPEQFDVSLPWDENEDEGGDVDEPSEPVTDGGQIELSPEAGAAVQTALNNEERYDMARDIGHPGDGSVIDVSDRDVILSTLKIMESTLEKTEGEPTLYDPNGRDVYLKWTRKAIEEVSHKPELITD